MFSGISMNLGDSVIKPAPKVKNLGVYLDQHLTMEAQVRQIEKACYFQINNIYRIRKFLTLDSCKSLVQALVTSRIDYCNALLYGVPDKPIMKRLKKVQHSAARLVTRTLRHEHISPALKELHWLRIPERIEYKILLLTYKAIHGAAPSYMMDMINIYRPTRPLRSGLETNTNLRLHVPKYKLEKVGGRSFTVAAPKLWNSLPDSLKMAKTVDIFKKNLKTHLFKKSF